MVTETTDKVNQPNQTNNQKNLCAMITHEGVANHSAVNADLVGPTREKVNLGQQAKEGAKKSTEGQQARRGGAGFKPRPKSGSFLDPGTAHAICSKILCLGPPKFSPKFGTKVNLKSEKGNKSRN